MNLLINEELPSLIEIDGYKIDPATGEVVEITALPKPDFRVTDAESADWVLKKICDAESEIARLDMVLASVRERLEADRKAQARRVEYLKAKFGADLEEFAKENLPKGKRTWHGTWGEVAFRSTKPRLDIEDDAKALAWAKASPLTESAVKVTEKLNKSELPADTVAFLLTDPELASIAGFKVVPASESCSISTVKP